MHDAIKAARWAAGEAARRAMIKPGCCMEGTGCELPPCHCSQAAADAAIEAFLRALPYHQMKARIGTNPARYSIETTSTVKLAAAVARAAQEGGR